jgi:hypothetical protein
MRRLSPVSASATPGNGVPWLTSYAAPVRIWLAILVTLAACKDHDLERLSHVRDDVCACKEASCADQAMARLDKLALASTPRSQAIAREIMECRARLEEAERPSTDPDAEDSGDPAASAGSAEPAAPKPVGAGSAAPSPGSGAGPARAPARP